MKVKWKMLMNFKNVVSDRYRVSNDGDVIDTYEPKLMHKKIANKKYHPYYAVYLKCVDGISRWVLVHQLVAYCFVKVPKRYKNATDLVPDHLDNDGLNNNYKNLEWKTRGENVKDAFKKGYINLSCENGRNALINNEQAHKICKALTENKTYNEILTELNLPLTKKYRTLLVRIKNGIAWTEISKLYNIDKSSYRYSETQLETIRNIPKIQELISTGYNNMEIARIIWGKKCCNLKSKAMTVGNIRNKKIFRNLL